MITPISMLRVRDADGAWHTETRYRYGVARSVRRWAKRLKLSDLRLPVRHRGGAM